MQIVNGFVCMNCTDVERAQKFIDPAHPDQGPKLSGPRDPANETAGPTGALTPNAVSFGGALSHLNALDNRHPSDPRPGAAGASLDILA